MIVCAIRRASALVTRKKALALRTDDVRKGAEYRTSSEHGSHTTSLIHEALNSVTRQSPAMRLSLQAVPGHSSTADKRILINLALSEVMLTIHIPPLLPVQNGDNVTIYLPLRIVTTMVTPSSPRLGRR